MATVLARRRRASDAPYWPGFVDAMAQLLLVITFLLSVFIVAQFLLARQISGQDSALGQLRSKIAELSELLAMEKSSKAELETNLAGLTDDLTSEKSKNAELASMLEPLAEPLRRERRSAISRQEEKAAPLRQFEDRLQLRMNWYQ